MIIPSVKVDTTTRCQLSCRGCTAEGWRRNNPKYNLTLKQFRSFLRACVVSDYRIQRLIYSGGEPLLWRHLSKAVQEAKASGVAVTQEIWTNAMNVRDPSLLPVLKAVDIVRVSGFKSNQGEVQYLRAQGVTVLVVDKSEFYLPPPGAVPDSLPARCRCPHIELCGDMLYPCALVLWNSEAAGAPVPDGMSTNVAPGFMARLDQKAVLNMDMCRSCTGNWKVASVCPRVQP